MEQQKKLLLFTFKDNVDGKLAYIIADGKAAAIKFMKEKTSIPFHICKAVQLNKLKKSFIVKSDILPF